MQNFFKIWFPKYVVNRPDIEPYLRFILGLGYLGICLQTCLIILNLFSGIPIYPTNLPIVGFISLLLVVRFSPSYNLAALYFILVFFLGILLTATLYQSFPYTIFLWIPVFTVTCVYLLDRKSGAIWPILLVTSISIAINFFSTNAGQKIEIEQMKPIVIVTIAITAFATYYVSMLFRNYISKLSDQLDMQNQLLQQQKTTLQENMEDKKSLIAIVCHDIANPLTIILSAAQQGMKEDSDKIKCFEKINRCSNLIRDLIDEVRNYQAIEFGKFEINLEKTDLLEILESIKFLFSDRLASKNLELMFDYDDTKSYYVLAEAQSLTNSVLSNLISNAIKFSNPGDKIILSLKDDNGKVSLSIRDFGIGMPENLTKNLFKKDTKTSRIGTKGEKGTGFGMPITKVYLDKYGADIQVVSKEKKSEDDKEHGTTFTLTFSKG